MNDTASTPPPFIPGLFDDVPATDYHAVEALSSSGVRKLLQSPMHYRLFRDQPTPPTAQMQFGTAVHCGVLEPDTFFVRVACAPVVDKRTNAGKAQWLEFVASCAPGCIVLPTADYIRARACIDAVLSHPSARRLLEGATVERSLFWNDAEYNVPCKARFDAWNDGVLADLKTTADASKPEFARSISSFFYHAQAALYCSGAEHVLDRSPDAFVFIAVESEPPHAVAVYDLGNASIRTGMHLISEAQARYSAVLASGKWSGYPDTIETIEVPRYAMRIAA